MVIAEQDYLHIGKYAIIERLDAGGSAEVFVAQREGDSKLCVLKRLHTRLEGHPVAPKRLHREAHLASFLRHPNIAQVYGAGLEDGRFVVAFEFVAGQTIEAISQTIDAKGRRLPLEVCLGIAYAVLDALEYAHDLKDPDAKALDIVHRDLSPRNILLGYDGTARLIDFGVARGNFDEFRTEPGVVVGTLRYLSPEQALTLEVDRRSDLYTLAVVLFELLSGRPLVPDGPPIDTLRYVVNQPAPPVTQVDPTLPRALEPIFAKALAKDREQRFPNAASFREAFMRIPNLPKPATQQEMGALVRELFPDGVAWAARIAAKAARASEDHHPPPIRAATDLSTPTSPSGEIPLATSTVSFTDKTRSEITVDPTERPTQIGTARIISNPKQPNIAASDTPTIDEYPLPPRDAALPRSFSFAPAPVEVLTASNAQPPPGPASTAEVERLRVQVAALEQRTRSLSRFVMMLSGLCVLLAVTLALRVALPDAGWLSSQPAPKEEHHQAEAEKPRPPQVALQDPKPAPDPQVLAGTSPERPAEAEAAHEEEEEDAPAADAAPENPKVDRPVSTPKRIGSRRSLGERRRGPARLKDMLRAVREHPSDQKLFEDLAGAIYKESAHLPEGTRRKVELLIFEANSARSPEKLERAINQFSRSN